MRKVDTCTCKRNQSVTILNSACKKEHVSDEGAMG